MDRDKHRFAVFAIQEFSSCLSDQNGPAENRLNGGGAEAYDEFGMNTLHLRFEPRLTSQDLSHRWFLMQAPFAPLNPSKMFDGVGDINFVPRDAGLGKCFIEHLARRAHEWMPLAIFYVAV